MLNHYFFDGPVDFEKRCRSRILTSAVFVILGLLTLALTACALSYSQLSALGVKQETAERLASIYIPLGTALTAAGLIRIRRNRILLKNPDLRKKAEIKETDERNQLLGLRCWAYAGYAMFLLLYIGVLGTGFFSSVVMNILLSVIGVFALLLLIFRLILQRCM